MDEIIELLRRAIAIFGSDPEGANAILADLYSDDVHFEDPIQTLRGRDEFLAMNLRLARRMKRIDFELGEVVRGDGTLFLVWTMRVEPKVGPQLAFEGVSHLRLRDGRVIYHRDYWDLLGSIVGSLPVARAVYKAALQRLG